MKKSQHISVKRVRVRKKYYVQASYDSVIKFRIKWNRKNSLNNVKKRINNKEKGFVVKRDYDKHGVKSVTRLKNVKYSRINKKPMNAKRVCKVGEFYAEIQVSDATYNDSVTVRSPSVIITGGKMFRYGREVSKEYLDKKMRKAAYFLFIRKYQEEGYNIDSGDFISMKGACNVRWETITPI